MNCLTIIDKRQYLLEELRKTREFLRFNVLFAEEKLLNKKDKE